MLIDVLLKNSWKDKNGNILTFIDNRKNKDNTVLLLIDGSDCSEGIEEEVFIDIEDICNDLIWYGYTELKDKFLAEISNIR